MAVVCDTSRQSRSVQNECVKEVVVEKTKAGTEQVFYARCCVVSVVLWTMSLEDVDLIRR